MRLLSIGLALVLFYAPHSIAAELTGTLKAIAERGSIVLGYREAQPPMAFKDQSGAPIGYSIDLCGHIAAAVKQNIGRADLLTEFVAVTADNRFDAIQSGRIDILCGATTKTLGRSERVDFTQLTFVTGAGLLSRDDAHVENLLGLAGKKVAVTESTTTIATLRQTLEKRLVDAEVVSVGSAEEGMAMLDAGTVDAFSADQVVLIGLVLARPSQKKYFLSGELYSFEPFALAVRRNDADFRLVADRALATLYRTKQIRAIYKKWFGRFAAKVPNLLKAVYKIGATPE
jgi:ABC-type amino acid transport substrate-binding protein